MIRPLPVIGGGSASSADIDAAAELEAHEVARLNTVRGRAEKWLNALTAFTGLIGTVLVIKGPDSSGDIATGWRVLVALLIAGALAALVYAVYRAYQSAYGAPGRLDEVRTQPLAGLAVRLDATRRGTAGAAQQHLRHAVTATFISIPLLAGAVAVTWFAPKPPTAPSIDHVCVLMDGNTIAKINGDGLNVAMVVAGTEIRPCA